MNQKTLFRQVPQIAAVCLSLLHVSAQPAAVNARAAHIDRLLQGFVDAEKIAGANVLVLQNGRPVYEKSFGWSDKEAKRKMAPDTLFRIASQTKAITSAAIMTLVEEGKVGINEPVGNFIPSFKKATVAQVENNGIKFVDVKRPITVFDLLTHSAGISYGREAHVAALYEAKELGAKAGNGWYTADKTEPVCDTMETLGTIPFVRQPGEAFVYGYNTDILGCIVEKASGMPLDQYVAKKITGPLGMKNTFFYVPTAERERLAAVYMTGTNMGKAERAPEGSRGQGHYVDGPRKSFAGGAGLISTARDYARFLEMVRNGGIVDGVRVLSPRAVELMTTNQIGALRGPQGLGFGLGFETVDRYGAAGMASVGSFGWGGAYGTTYQVDRKSGLVTVLMLQLMPNGTDIQPKFYQTVYQAFGK
ncbi:serine hydrolase [Bryobacterales bacterium F-183]|nr:serine hydrolase [Bryobacterales bacterium F-183]